MGLIGVADRINKKASFLDLPELRNGGEVPVSLEGWVEIFEKEMTRPRPSGENLIEILEEKVQEVPKDEILSVLEKLFKSHSFKFFLNQDEQATAFFIGLLIKELDNALVKEPPKSLKEHFSFLDNLDKDIFAKLEFPARFKKEFFLFKVERLFEKRKREGLGNKKAAQKSLERGMAELFYCPKFGLGLITALCNTYDRNIVNKCIDCLDSLSLMQYIAGKEIDKEAGSLISNRLSLLEMIKTLPALERSERKSFLEKIPELRISKVRQFFLKISCYIIQILQEFIDKNRHGE